MYFTNKINRISSKPRALSKKTANNEKLLRTLLDDIKSRKYQQIVFIVGAGISTAAGIPDFRSPKTGLYSNLQKFNLPYPEAVFDIDYLRENPKPFFLLARELYPSQFEPTEFHRFMKKCCDVGVVKRIYTQNIDTLERRAGIPDGLIVEAHGSFHGQHCIDCGKEADRANTEVLILKQEVPKCIECSGIVKPDIVFFGEGLPRRFFEMIEIDFDDADLVIVAGTSLQVSPFNQLPDLPTHQVPRYLLNMDQVGTLGYRRHDKLILGDLTKLDLVFREFLDEKRTEKTSTVTGIDASTENETETETGQATAAEEDGLVSGNAQEGPENENLKSDIGEEKIDIKGEDPSDDGKRQPSVADLINQLNLNDQ